MRATEEPVTLSVVRKALLIILVLGIAGVLLELLLLEHTDGKLQLLPVGLLVAGLLVVSGHVVIPANGALLRALQAAMALFVVSGAAGVFFHYRGNAEFEVERNVAIAGFDLFRESMMGATPALAPGAMVQLGLIGLAYTFRHPALSRQETSRAV